MRGHHIMKSIGMRFWTVTAAVLAVAVLFGGCNRDKFPEPYFTEDSSLTFRESVIMDYDELKHQFSINSDNGVYSMFLDDYSEYFVLRLNTLPQSEGQNVKGSLTWKTRASQKEFKDLEFRTVDVGSDGRVKIWNSRYGIGAVLMLPEI